MTLLATQEFEGAVAAASFDPSAEPFALRTPRSRSLTYEGNVGTSLRSNPIINRGEQNSTWRHRSSTDECADWLKEHLRHKSAKTISHEAGVGQRAAEAVKLGRNGWTMAHLVSMCRSDPDFRQQFFYFCGGHIESDPEMARGLTLAINSYLRSRESR